MGARPKPPDVTFLHFLTCFIYMYFIFHFRKKEEESKRRLLENPIRMKQIQKMVSKVLYIRMYKSNGGKL